MSTPIEIGLIYEVTGYQILANVRKICRKRKLLRIDSLDYKIEGIIQRETANFEILSYDMLILQHTLLMSMNRVSRKEDDGFELL